MHNEDVDMRQTLYEMMFSDPDVVLCINRIGNSCMHGSFTITEGGREVTPKLREQLLPRYEIFMRDCIRMIYLCGFAAFYIRKVNKIPLPFCPAIGSFTWDTTASTKRGEGNALYTIHVTHGDVKDREVHIINYYSPILGQNMKTPMLSLLRHFIVMREVASSVQAVAKFNREKHVVIHEHIDVKDQTTSGLQLLDDVRRYTLTGQHSLMGDRLQKLKSRDNKTLGNTNDAKFHWIQTQFAASDHNSQARVSTHVLPPNMEMTELGPLTSSTDYEVCVTHYKEAVYTFFGIQNASNLSIATKTASDFVSMEHHMQTRNISNFLQHVAEKAYAVGFDVELHQVEIVLHGVPRAAINSTDDIKKLSDAELLGGPDKKKLKKMYSDEL